MNDWLLNLIAGIGDALGSSLENAGELLSGAIWDTMLHWFYTTIYGAIGEFFASMGNLGAEIFSLGWVLAVVRLFSLLGWALYATGVAVAVFDVAIEYQSGKATIKTTALNVLKGFFACSLLGTLPVSLYQFCVSLQSVFTRDLAGAMADAQGETLAELSNFVLQGMFAIETGIQCTLFNLLELIAFAYCVVKIFFANIKRGGILLIQIAVGSLYLFSVPRGYTDGFYQWMKQVIALCLTAFLQTTMLFLGLLTFSEHQLLGLGIMLAAKEVPRIAQQFGMDTSARLNVSGIVQTTATAVKIAQAVAAK